MREADCVFPTHAVPSSHTSPVVVFRDVSESSDEGTAEGLQGTKKQHFEIKRRNRFVVVDTVLFIWDSNVLQRIHTNAIMNSASQKDKKNDRKSMISHMDVTIKVFFFM